MRQGLGNPPIQANMPVNNRCSFIENHCIHLFVEVFAGVSHVFAEKQG